MFLFLFSFWNVEDRRAMLWVIEVPEPGAEERIARVEKLIKLFVLQIQEGFNTNNV